VLAEALLLNPHWWHYGRVARAGQDHLYIRCLAEGTGKTVDGFSAGYSGFAGRKLRGTMAFMLVGESCW
jgi:hypothetical protein